MSVSVSANTESPWSVPVSVSNKKIGMSVSVFVVRYVKFGMSVFVSVCGHVISNTDTDTET